MASVLDMSLHRGPQTMTLEEIKRSRLLVSLDVILFFGCAVLAMKYWLETHGRLRALRRLGAEIDSLAMRRLFLQLLSLANAMRAVGLVLDAEFRSNFLFRGAKKKFLIKFHREMDYIISSLPTMVWSSMLSVLLLYVAEVYQRSQLRRAWPLLRPAVAMFNVVAYLLYVIITIRTMRETRYADFRCSVYLLLGCSHVLLVLGLARYGCGLAWQLRQRTENSQAVVDLQESSTFVLGRVSVLVALLPCTELVRTVNDFQYSLGGMPFNLHSGWPDLLFLACAKLVLEWVPSVAILWAFAPRHRRSSGQLAACKS